MPFDRTMMRKTEFICEQFVFLSFIDEFGDIVGANRCDGCVCVCVTWFRIDRMLCVEKNGTVVTPFLIMMNDNAVFFLSLVLFHFFLQSNATQCAEDNVQRFFFIITLNGQMQCEHG